MDAHQTSLYHAVLLTSIIIGSILIYFIISLIRHQRKNKELYNAKIMAEITTLENERARVASDLHDELGPLLSAIKFKLSSVETHLPEDEMIMEEASEHIVEIIGRMREISNDLMPNTLVRKGLVLAIDEFIHKVCRNIAAGDDDKTMNIHFDHDELPELPKQMSINIYRIVQEIVHNAIKHSGASDLHLEIRPKGNTIILKSQDNGTGFDYNTASKENSGLGLKSLLSRTEIMNGDLYIDSKAGKGTLYTIEIPIK